MRDQNDAGVAGVVTREVEAVVVFSDKPNCLQSSGVNDRTATTITDIVPYGLVNQIHTGVRSISVVDYSGCPHPGVESHFKPLKHLQDRLRV